LRKELVKEQTALSEREREIKRRETALQAAEQDIENQVQKRLAAEMARLSKTALEKARGEVSLEIADLREQAAEKGRKLKEAQEAELRLRKEKRELEEAKKAFELDAARTLDAERGKIREDALREAVDSHRLKDAEKDRKLQEALRVNEELRRKLEQGSQQTQGEVLELELESLLRTSCPLDEILPVPTGVRGADVFQRVRTRTGFSCGAILWETKHTKNWSDGWISKLKTDQQEAKADIAVLVTDVLPKDVDGFGFKEGVWVTCSRYVPAVLMALRQNLTQVALAKSTAASKDETVEALYQYLTGPEFRHRVEAIIRAFMKMKEDLEEEKRVTQRRWSKREKQLDLIIGNTSGMYGDLQGLLGTSIQPIPALEAGDAPEIDEVPMDSESLPPESDNDEDVPF